MKNKTILLFDVLWTELFMPYRKIFLAQTGIICSVESRYGFTGCRTITNQLFANVRMTRWTLSG